MIDKLIEQQETIKSMQENEESAIKIMKMYKDYKLRTDKAIEYIWSTKYEWGDLEEDNEDFDIDVYKLLNILKGEDKEC